MMGDPPALLLLCSCSPLLLDPLQPSGSWASPKPRGAELLAVGPWLLVMLRSLGSSVPPRESQIPSDAVGPQLLDISKSPAMLSSL